MKSTMFYMLEKYCNVFFISIFGFYVAKVSSSNIFGIFSHVEAVIAILSIFSLQGVDQVIQRDIVNKSESIRMIISSAFSVKLMVSSFIVAAILLYSLNRTSDLFYQAIIPFSFLIIFRSLLFISSILICENRYKEFSIIGVTVVIFSFIFKMIIISSHCDIRTISFLSIVDTLALVTVYLYFYIRQYGIKFSINAKYCRKLVSEGGVLALSGGMIIIYTKIDQIFIANFLGNKALADYSIAIKFINLFVLGSTVFSLSFTRKLNKTLPSYKKSVKQLIVSSLLAGLFLAVLSSIITPYLIDFFYQDKFKLSKDYVVWLSLVIPFAYLLANIGRVLINENQTDAIFKRNFGALIINVILNYILIPKFGVHGAIFSTIISYFFSSTLYLLINTRTRTLLLGFIK